MVAPTAFGFNEQTAQDNHFMHATGSDGEGSGGSNGSGLLAQVTGEFAGLHHQLTEVHGARRRTRMAAMHIPACATSAAQRTCRVTTQAQGPRSCMSLREVTAAHACRGEREPDAACAGAWHSGRSVSEQLVFDARCRRGSRRDGTAHNGAVPHEVSQPCSGAAPRAGAAAAAEGI
jgi:hypothetical protein